jgi:hypothetical protein
MKKICTIIVAAAICSQASAQVTWSVPVTVASSTYGNLHPRISLNRSGNPYILWGKTDTKAYFSKWNGTGFTTPYMASGALTVFAQSWAGPDMAAFGDTVYITMKVTPETDTAHHCYLAHSYDGGMTFSTPVKIDNIDTSLSRFPLVTTTSAGNPLVTFMKFNSMFGNAQYVVTRSTDGGATFSPDVVASTGTNPVCDCCPASIISSGSKAVVLFRNNAANIRDTWAGVSNDGGMTFPGHMNVDNNAWMFMSCPSSGPDGFIIGDSLYSVFRSSASGTSLVYFSRATISGLSAATVPITGTFSGLTSQDYPRIANDGNAAAAVWVQNTSSGKYVAYSFASNIISGFSGYSTATGATGSGILNADVAMKNGAIHIVWEDGTTGTVKYLKGTYPVTTSVNEVIAKEVIEVYPNPASEDFAVSLKNVSNISYSYLADMTGRRMDIVPITANGKATFSLKGVAKGNYYFVMGDDKGKEYYSKIVLQ